MQLESSVERWILEGKDYGGMLDELWYALHGYYLEENGKRLD